MVHSKLNESGGRGACIPFTDQPTRRQTLSQTHRLDGRLDWSRVRKQVASNEFPTRLALSRPEVQEAKPKRSANLLPDRQSHPRQRKRAGRVTCAKATTITPMPAPRVHPQTVGVLISLRAVQRFVQRPPSGERFRLGGLTQTHCYSTASGIFCRPFALHCLGQCWVGALRECAARRGI